MGFTEFSVQKESDFNKKRKQTKRWLSFEETSNFLKGKKPS